MSYRDLVHCESERDKAIAKMLVLQDCVTKGSNAYSQDCVLNCTHSTSVLLDKLLSLCLPLWKSFDGKVLWVYWFTCDSR